MQEQPINLMDITDIDKLKAKAFDQVQALEVAQANLRNIQQRIAQLEEAPADAPAKE